MSTAPAPPPLPGSSSLSGGTPWERRGEIGFLPALFETTKQVLLSPALFFRGMPVGPGLADPLLYAVILGYAGVIVQALYQAFFHVALGSLLPRGFGGRSELARALPFLEGGVGLIVQVVVGPILVILGLFVGAGIYHLVLLLLGGARRGFEGTFRVSAYGQAVSVLMAFPFCGGVVALVWWVVVATIGLSEVHGIGRGRALAALLIPVVLLCCCCGGILGVFGGLLSTLARSR
jgi:hypothetical protein